MTIFALMDCNNFYVSCERAFNPRLEGKPVVVLSNNDGNVISRSNEAKKLGIPMGVPFFQCKAFCEAHDVQVFSSNYELYGDMSHRVMSVLKEHCPFVEVYSIDEAFLVLDGVNNLFEFLVDLREKIKRGLGLPVAMGFAQTKTLAKVANHVAKNQTREGVFDLRDTAVKLKMLADLPVGKIWGIGTRLSARLEKLNIFTAKELHDADPKMLRMHFSVTVEKTVQELRGVSCIPVEEVQPRKQIISSRSFGHKVTKLQDLEEAVSHYAAIASLKLRRQNCVAAAVSVFVQTNVFKKEERQYQNARTLTFPMPTADTMYVIGIAKRCLHLIYRKGFRYHKCGLMLLDISPESVRQYDMLLQSVNKKRVAQVVDHINEKLGKNTVFYCAEGIEQEWGIRADKISSRYTTRLVEVLKLQ